ncbi:MAG: 50S ribosomal protein L29 [Syntrophales bacterium]|nr:50S ribosomal protein L29 [Syntrophales bacterium]
MKIKEIREIDIDELKQKEREFVEELFKLRMQHTTGQLDSPLMMKKVRKNIARIKTVLREREAQI